MMSWALYFLGMGLCWIVLPLFIKYVKHQAYLTNGDLVGIGLISSIPVLNCFIGGYFGLIGVIMYLLDRVPDGWFSMPAFKQKDKE